MGAEVSSWMGYTVVMLVLVALVSGLLGAKVYQMGNVDDFKMTYAANDVALLTDTIRMAPNEVILSYDVNFDNLSVDFNDGLVSVKKGKDSNTLYGKKVYRRYGKSLIKKMDDYSFYFEDSINLIFSSSKSNLKIIDSSLVSETVDSIVETCTEFKLDAKKDDFIIDFPIADKLDGEDSISVKNSFAVGQLLSNNGFELSRNKVTTNDNFKESIKSYSDKKVYVYFTQSLTSNNLEIISKGHNNYEKYISCLFKNNFKSHYSVSNSFELVDSFSKFNDIDTDYVFIINMGSEVQKELSFFEISKKIAKIFEESLS